MFVVDVNDRRDVKFLYQAEGGPVHFSQGPDGYVYYADLFTGVIGRLLIEPFQIDGTLVARGNTTYDSASDVYTLTSSGQQAGTVMSTGRIDLRQNFAISFQAYLGTNDGGADGLAFLIHNDPAGFNAIGAPGGGLAIGGIQNGLAIEFDTYANSPGDIINGGLDTIANDHTSFLDTDGPFGTTLFDLGNIEDGQWHSVSITWNAVTQTLSYTFDGQQVGTLSADIVSGYLGGSDFAYFGFGAGTGGLANDQRVRVTSIDATLEGQTPDDGPVANADAATTSADTLVNIDVLANDTDPNGDALTITSAQSTTGTDGRSDLGAEVTITGSGDGQRIRYDGSAPNFRSGPCRGSHADRPVLLRHLRWQRRHGDGDSNRHRDRGERPSIDLIEWW